MCLISQTSTQHGRQQAGDGTDGARSEGSSRLAASINQCHALEPHLCREARHWSSVLAFLCLDIYPVNTRAQEQMQARLIYQWNVWVVRPRRIQFYTYLPTYVIPINMNVWWIWHWFLKISYFSVTISFTGQVCSYKEYDWRFTAGLYITTILK